MHKIILQRIQEFENIKKPNKDKVEGSTLGLFEVFNDTNERVYSCYTIENAGPSTDESGKDLRIMPRTYTLHWTKSSKTPKGEEQCIWLHAPDLPSFASRRILIHIGNYPQDTEGCLLLNKTSTGNGIGAGSTLACKEFYDLVKRVGIENFELEVREINQQEVREINQQ